MADAATARQYQQAAVRHSCTRRRGARRAWAPPCNNASCGRAPVLISSRGSPPTRSRARSAAAAAPSLHPLGSRTCRTRSRLSRSTAATRARCKTEEDGQGGFWLRPVRKSGLTGGSKMVFRALSFAMSDPRGRARWYLYGAREAMEQEIEPCTAWTASGSGSRSRARHCLSRGWRSPSQRLLVLGQVAAGRGRLQRTESRNPRASWCDWRIPFPGLRVLDTGGSDMCFPADHPWSEPYSAGASR